MPRFDRQHLRGYHATRRQCPGLPALLVATLTLAGSPALAQSYTWSGGNGATWDTSAANWTDATGTPWDATAGTTGTATFVATSGSATVDGTVYANRIDYTAASGTFAIRNGTINLAGTTPTISVNPARTFTIGSVLDGSAGLVKSGSGNLALSGANTYSGPTTSGGGGILRADSQTAFGTGVVSTSTTSGASSIQLSSGTYANDFTVSGDGAGFIGSLAGVNNSTTFIDGVVTLSGQAGLGAGSNGTMTLRGGLSGTDQNFFARSGTIVVDSAGWNVSGLQANANSTIVVSKTGTATFLVRLNGTGSVIRTDVTNAWGAGGWVNFHSGTSGTLNLNGNNQTASRISTTDGLLAAGGTGRVVTSAAPATFTTNQTTSHIFDGIFTGAAALTKAGGPTTTLTLTGPSTSTGKLTISSGSIALGTSGTGTAVQVGAWAGDVDIASAAALIGEGTVGGLASVAGGGMLAPGITTTPGTLALSGGLALNPTSILRFDLNATNTTVGSGINDLINVTGNFTLGGTLDVTGIGDFTTAASGSVWRLFNYSGGSFDGSLALGSLPTLADGLTFAIDTATPGQVNLAVVPEPSALLLAGLGLAAALGMARRQRRLTAEIDR
jgi:fibronectin-binding autotransporter adhesin